MDDAIRGIPSLRGPSSISHGRRDGRRRDRDFEEALAEGGDRAEPEPPPNPLKRRLPTGRRDDQSGRHIDVLA